MLRSAGFFLIIALLSSLPLKAAGAELVRRAFMGIAMAPLSDAQRAEAGIPAGEGVLIERVIPGSSAEKAGLRAGDIPIRIDQQNIRSAADVAAAVRQKRAGGSIALSVIRNGKPIEHDIALIGLPEESSPSYETLYESVAADGALRRTILTKPRGEARHPAILLVGGIGCYSMDSPLDTANPYRRLLDDLTRQGFATMRVEKSGMGDSEGEPCATVDLKTELEGYVAGLQALKAKPYVNPDKVFIVGHSIGGIVGPLVAERVPVRGIVVAETVGTTWFEYELINRRRQLKLEGMEPGKIGAQMALKQWCMHQLLIERQPRQQILEKRPACSAEMRIPSSDAYLQQVAAIDLPALWTRLKPDTLVIYGSSDFLTSTEEHREIVDAINAAKPGAATYVEIAGMDHSFYRMKDQSESFRYRHSGNPGEHHADLGPIVARWLKERT